MMPNIIGGKPRKPDDTTPTRNVARHDDEVEIASLGGCAQSADQLSDLLVVVNQLDIIEADEVVLPAQQIQQIVVVHQHIVERLTELTIKTS